LSRILGSAPDRKAARRALALTVAQLSELTGLSVAQIRRRESTHWLMQRSSLDSDQGWRYVIFLAHARQMEDLLTNPLGVDE
jgi:hypothetical protein